MVGSCMISRLLPVSLWLSPYSIFLHSSHPRFFLISPLALIWPRTCPYFHSATARNISIHAVSIHHLHLSRDVILHNCPFFHSPRPLPLLYFSTLFLPHLFSTSCHCIPSTSLSSIHSFIIFITATASGSTEGLILSSHLTSPHQPVASPLHQNIFHPTSLYPVRPSTSVPILSTPPAPPPPIPDISCELPHPHCTTLTTGAQSAL